MAVLPTNTLWSVLLMLTGIVTATQEQCAEDYSPCICGQDSIGNLYINCIDVLPQDIQDVFNKTTALDIFSLVLILPNEGASIPADLLVGKRASIIDLVGTNTDSFELIVNSDALRSSSAYTQQLVISKCNLNRLDFAFLKGFSKLVEFRLDYTSGIKPIENLPPLINLAGLTIDNSKGFEELTQFPAFAFSRLERLYLYNDELNDHTLEIIMDSFVSSMSVETLTTLTLGNNRITRVPHQIRSLSRIIELALSNNNITLLSNGALTLSAPNIEAVFLKNASLSFIEDNAFQGDYRNTVVDLSFNNLTTFESTAFQGILTQMTQTGNGSINFESNPFVCDCSIAWIIRDNYDLLKATKGATCSNSTLFEDLDPNWFELC